MTQTDPANVEQDKILAPLLKRADVQALLRQGNEKKELSYQDFLAALPDDDFDERQVDAVYRHIIEAGVTIVNQEELDTEPPEIELATIEVESAAEDAAEETSDLPLAAVTDDPVKLYLREIGAYPLLQPAEEMWLAMRISAAGYVVDVLNETGPSRRSKAQRAAAQAWRAELVQLKHEPFAMPARVDPPAGVVPADLIGILLEELLTDWPLFARICDRMGASPEALIEPVALRNL